MAETLTCLYDHRNGTPASKESVVITAGGNLQQIGQDGKVAKYSHDHLDAHLMAPSQRGKLIPRADTYSGRITQVPCHKGKWCGPPIWFSVFPTPVGCSGQERCRLM